MGWIPARWIRHTTELVSDFIHLAYEIRELVFIYNLPMHLFLFRLDEAVELFALLWLHERVKVGRDCVLVENWQVLLDKILDQ